MAEPDESLDHDALFAPLAGLCHIAVAVSGGGDSMALLHLLHEWSKKTPTPPVIIALTVDHGLRAESAAEADCVAEICAELEIPHQIMHWRRKGDERGNLSALARTARYALMAEVCDALDVDALLTAHTLDDQAETVLMRLARGSGVDGLAAIPRCSSVHGIPVMRPLLDVTRSALRDYLRARGAKWVEDPTNQDPRYDRVKARNMLMHRDALALSPQRLAATANTMELARAVLEDAADTLEAQAVRAMTRGYFLLASKAFRVAHKETALRVLARVIGRLSGESYRPRLEALMGIYNAVLVPDGAKNATLQGCRVIAYGKGAALVREAAACEAPRALRPGYQVWDGRFEISLEDEPDVALQIAPLGEEGWAALCRSEEQTIRIRAAPHAARLTLPALFHGRELIALPGEEVWLDSMAQGCIIRPLPPFKDGAVEQTAIFAI